jgi:hypothetical protein
MDLPLKQGVLPPPPLQRLGNIAVGLLPLPHSTSNMHHMADLQLQEVVGADQGSTR